MLFFQYISSIFLVKFYHRITHIFYHRERGHWLAVIVDNPKASIQEKSTDDDDDTDNDMNESEIGQSGLNNSDHDSDTMGPESEEEDTETDNHSPKT